MPAICRVGDKHSCGAEDTEGSPDVFVNGQPIHRQGDGHSHNGTMVQFSPTVFANGKGVCRIGDNISGHPFHVPNGENSGSPDVFSN